MNTLTFVNMTESVPRLAVFRQNFGTPSLGLIAWKVITPPPEGRCSIELPLEMEVFVSSGERPGSGCQTRRVAVRGTTATIRVLAVPSDDRTECVPTIVQSGATVEGELQIRNAFSHGVWAHFQLAGADVFPPQIVSPNEVLIADIRRIFWVAHVTEYVRTGAVLLESMVSSTATPIPPGQVLTITGTRMSGFNFTVV